MSESIAGCGCSVCRAVRDDREAAYAALGRKVVEEGHVSTAIATLREAERICKDIYEGRAKRYEDAYGVRARITNSITMLRLVQDEADRLSKEGTDAHESA